MAAQPAQLDLPELAERADVSVRTIRYYLQQGLLPKPEARGPGAHYTAEHLERLLLIKRLQREHLPLAEIRRVLDTVVDLPHETDSAVAPPAEDSPTTRSQWERFALAPDVELHIRRPLSRTMNKQVDRLIDAARQIIKDDR